jgi:membrane-associated phospholipid phosphatase
LKQSKISAALFPEDKITLIFSVIIIALQIYFGLYTAIIVPAISIIVLLIFIYFQTGSESRVLKFIRSYIHIPIYGIIFTAFQTFVHKLNPNDYDWILLKADLTVFRFDASVWLERFVNRYLTEALILSYFSYYILPSLTFLLLYIQKNNDHSYTNTRRYLLAMVTGWYFALIFYLVLPAAGPDIAFPSHYSKSLVGLSPLTITYFESVTKYLRESSVRNTFPSMHFAIILITNYFAFKYRKNYFLFCTLPLGILLGIAALYLRQHYLIDLAGSVPMAAFSIYIASKFINYRKF